MNIRDKIIEGILTKMAGRAEQNIKSGAKFIGKKAKQGLAHLGKKAAYGAGRLTGRAIKAFKEGPKHAVGESTSNLHDRIIEILVESKLMQYLGEKPARKVGPTGTLANQIASKEIRSAQAARLKKFRKGPAGGLRRNILKAMTQVRREENPYAPISNGEKAKRRKP
jgi:hypothetical protein